MFEHAELFLFATDSLHSNGYPLHVGCLFLYGCL